MRQMLWETECPPRDVWQTLLERRKPLVLYGMGNGADKLIAQLEERGMTYADVFASDGFVRGQSFHGRRVLSFSEARERYSDFTVLVAFATHIPEVLGQIYRMNDAYDCLMPDLPVTGEAIFDRSFYLSHLDEIRQTAALLADDASREVYDATLRYKLTGELRYLRQTGQGTYDTDGILHPERYKRTLDGGAYRGDTAEKLLSVAKGVREIVAFEPDPRTFRHLAAYAEREQRCRVRAISAALSDRVGEASFSVSGNRNATLAAGGSFGAQRRTVPTVTVDSIGGELDYLKLDVEGAERQALLGAEETIAKHRPELLISLYHRSEDLFALPLLAASLCPGYRFFLRRNECIPAWELDLLAVPEEHF